MAKVLTYVTILVTVFALESYLGLGSSTTSQLLKTIGFTTTSSGQFAGFKAADLWGIVFSSTAGFLAAFGFAAGAIVGFIRSQSLVQSVLAGFVGVLAGWIGGDLITMYNNVNVGVGAEFSFIGSALVIFTAALLIGSIISTIQFWMGNDI